MEYELLDTGVFDEDRYFDVFVEYAKGGPDDILVRITATNRGPDAADLHLLPTLWFRNDWSRGLQSPTGLPQAEPAADRGAGGHERSSGTHPLLGEFILSCEGDVPLLFTENETNHERLFPGRRTRARTSRTESTTASSKGNHDAVNPGKQGHQSRSAIQDQRRRRQTRR